jgi:hypothetical protein
MKNLRVLIVLVAAFLFSATGFAQMAKTNLDAYSATFKMSENPYVKEIKIFVKEGKLMVTSDYNPTESIELTAATAADAFTASIQGNDAEINFTLKEGKASSMKLSVGGGQLVLTGEKLAASMADYVATFNASENPYVKQLIFTEKDGKLLMSSDAAPETVELTPSTAADTFTASVQGNDAVISFTRTDGKVTDMKLSIGGGMFELTGKRQ